MTTKEWLMRGWKIDKEINALISAQNRAYEQLIGGAVSYGEKVQKSKQNSQEEMRLTYIAYEEKINRRIDELNAVKIEIHSAIEEVESSVLRILLIERYINYKTWNEIADEMGYSYKHVVHNLHSHALKKIAPILES